MPRLGGWRFNRNLYLFPIIGFVFLVLYAGTTQDTPGDTRDYITDVIRYKLSGGSAPPSLLWEFGHLLWRPLGYACWQSTAPLTSMWFHGNPMMEVAAVFWAFNFISGLCLVFVVLAIARRLGVKQTVAPVVAFSVLGCSAVLNYLHSGTSYIPGLALQMIGLWFVLKAVQDDHGRIVNAVWSGFAMALACALWFPYFFGIPAILMAAFLLPAHDNAQVRTERHGMVLFAYVLSATTAFGVAFFAAGAVLAHVASVSQLHDWIVSSGHGMTAHQRLLRFPTGLARTFFYLGDEGLTIKRFVFKDPYAPVNWLVIAGGLWKIILVFLALGAIAVALFRNRNSRWALAVALGGIVPTLLFALLLFETSSAERYLPMFAGLVTAVCVLIRNRGVPRLAVYLLAVFVSAMIGVNLYAYAGKLPSEAKQSSARFALLHDHIDHGGVAMVLSVSDSLGVYLDRHPFNPQNQPNALPLYDVIGVHAHELGSWEADSSCELLQTWDTGANVLLSKRLVANAPKPDWGWVENDDPTATNWVHLRDFFKQLDIDANFGNADGFVQIARSAKNQRIVETMCPASNSAALLRLSQSKYDAGGGSVHAR